MNKFYKYATDTSLHATVILPGGCNAKCPFCYDISEAVLISDYKNKLKQTLDKVPVEAKKFGITGMETTISPYFKDVMELAKQYRQNGRFDFVFLNTNGFKLEEYAKEVSEGCDAVNISRHATDDEENFKIFGTRTVPTTEQLKTIIKSLKVESGVNINIVITDNEPEQEVKEKTFKMIDFCKHVGAKSLTLRFEAKDFLRTNELMSFLQKYKTLQYNANPGCRFWLKKIKNFNVVCKFVTKEPTSYSNWNYGFIIQRDLRITRDWAGKKPHSMSANKIIED